MVNSQLLDLFYPPQCLHCAKPVSAAHCLCPQCWLEIAFPAEKHCQTCGRHLPKEETATECGLCVNDPPPYEKLYFASLYQGIIKEMIHGFKYNDRHELLPCLSKILMQTLPKNLSIDYLIPVPLHRTRLRQRRFNQSAEFCKKISAQTGVPALLDVLIKTQNTKPQAQKSREARWKEITRLYRYQPKKKLALKGTNILLIDDVVTSSATIYGCAKALKHQAKVKTVNVLTLSRVIE